MTENTPVDPATSTDLVAVPADPGASGSESPRPAASAGPAPMLESEARTFAMLINLVAVLGTVFSAGTLSLVGVLVMWLMNRQRSALVDFHGKQQLNLAISLLIAAIAAVVGTLVTFLIGGLVLIPAIFAYGIWALIGSIIAAVRASAGDYYRIALVIPFIK